jgi:hypothetical protein
MEGVFENLNLTYSVFFVLVDTEVAADAAPYFTSRLHNLFYRLKKIPTEYNLLNINLHWFFKQHAQCPKSSHKIIKISAVFC